MCSYPYFASFLSLFLKLGHYIMSVLPPTRVLVVGSGISGLSFAHTLKKQLIDNGIATGRDQVEVILVEKAPDIGGWVC